MEMVALIDSGGITTYVWISLTAWGRGGEGKGRKEIVKMNSKLVLGLFVSFPHGKFL